VKTQLAGSGDDGVVGLRNRIQESGDEWGVADGLAELDLAEVKHVLADLTQVDAALARMRDGSYGECIDCGEPIAPARLKRTRRRSGASPARVPTRRSSPGRRSRPSRRRVSASARAGPPARSARASRRTRRTTAANSAASGSSGSRPGNHTSRAGRFFAFSVS
jgi:hypothetical protein